MSEEESTLLDLPGVMEVIGDNNETVSKNNEKSKSEQKVKPSGSGLMFYLDSSMEEHDEMEDYEVESTLDDPKVSSEIVAKSMVREVDAEQLQKELTEKG